MQNNHSRIAIVIPTYCPPDTFPLLVEKLTLLHLGMVIVVDDGSPLEYQDIISKLKGVHVLKHETNLGKGSALKTAFRFLIKLHPENFDYVLCCDDDGQHSLDDIHNLASIAGQSTVKKIFLGARSFSSQTPFKSRLGNHFSRFLFFFITGKLLQDTQTGLRCIPIMHLEALSSLRSRGFNFEMSALLYWVKSKLEIVEVPIETIYFDKNNKSRFRPIRDSFEVILGMFRQ